MYYSVKPTILAINLAAHWLKVTSPQRITTILSRLKGAQLDTKFIERLTDLDQIDKAQELVGQLWGTDGFFGSAEVLKSEWGSLLFRHVVEVNPEATMQSLVTAFFNLTTEELKAETASRRNLVWALEKLCFRKVTFGDAARLMYSFAVAENESWANNATAQFKQLFHLRLAGTEQPLHDRIPILKWGLAKNSSEYERIAILAIGAGLDNDHFSRAGGAERQGSSAPLKDYLPTTWEEIRSYWQELLNLVLPIAKRNDENGQLARNQISSSVRILVRDGMINSVSEVIREIKSSIDRWPEIIEALQRSLAYEGGRNDTTKAQIKELLSELVPQDFKTILHMKVTKPEWFWRGADSDLNNPQQHAEQLAIQIVTQKMDLYPYLSDLLTGEQRQGYNFGVKLGELWDDRVDFIDKALVVLKGFGAKDQNPELIAGFIRGSNDSKLREKVYAAFLHEPLIMHNAFYIARVFEVSIADLYRLFSLIENNGMPISYFINFQYGGFLKSYTPDEVIAFASNINEYPSGNWVALTLLFAYCFSEEDKWPLCATALKSIITAQNMIVNKSTQYQMDDFHWSSSIEKLLTLQHDEDFSKKVMQHLVEIALERDYDYGVDPYLPKIYRILFDQYFDSTWPIMGDVLLGKNFLFIMHTNHAIGADKGSRESPGILFENEERFNRLFDWCSQHPEAGPKRLSHMMPLSIKSDEGISLHPFAKRIIDTFGADREVLNTISANMGTYGTVGSRLPYLEGLLTLMQQLKEHPIDLVRQWAASEIKSLTKESKEEELDNEEELLR